MKMPLQVLFRGVKPSPALEQAARQRARRLDRYFSRIMSCRVDIELLQKHQHQGRPYGVRVHLTVPGREFTVDRVRHEDPYVALRDAFEDMKRHLEESVGRVRASRRTATSPTGKHELSPAMPASEAEAPNK